MVSQTITPPVADRPRPAKPEGLLKSLFLLGLLVLPISIGIALLGRWAQRGEQDLLFKELFDPAAELPLGYRYSGGTAVASEQRWLRLVPGETSPESLDGKPLPESIMIGRYGAPLAAQRQFDPTRIPSGKALAERVEAWTKDPKSDFDGLLASGTIAFGEYETDYLLLRHFRQTGEHYDLVRINLSTEQVGQMLEAHWADGQSGADPNSLLPILEALQLSASARVSGGGGQ